MPTMYEIYDLHAREYDALVEREDFRGNLCSALRSRFDWHEKVVAEPGIGTGRVTACYIELAGRVIGFDRSSHMLERAALNLTEWVSKVVLEPADHRSLPVGDGVADLFIEGWAFGHTIVDNPDDTLAVTRELIAEAERVSKPGAPIILIETLGTNTDQPAPPLPELAEFYRALEQEHGFVCDVLRTDYRFQSRAQAEHLCGFFFGKGMRDTVSRRLAGCPDDVAVEIPEFTGIWIRT